MKSIITNALIKLVNTDIYIKANILKATVLFSNALNFIHKAITEEDIIATKEVKSLSNYVLLIANKKLNNKSVEYSLVKTELLHDMCYFIPHHYFSLKTRENKLLEEIKSLKVLIKIKKERDSEK